MIDYDHQHWATTTLAWRGTVLSRLRNRIFFYGGWAAVVSVAAAGRTVPMPDFGALAHSLVGVAMGMLLVFRTNASYDRYWEGRKRWGGLIAGARSLLRVARAHVGDAGPLATYAHAYALSSMHLLRGETDEPAIAGIVGEEMAAAACSHSTPPNYFAALSSRWIANRVADGSLNAPLARELEGAITKMVEHEEACERILHTPVPFAYVVQIRQLLAFYLVTLPVVLVPVMDWMVVPVTAMVAFAMLGIEEAGIEIEDPFGDDPNDLPLERLCEQIRLDTAQLAAITDDELEAKPVG
jgi:putative membrane protein